jgi:hypothetical protein
MQLKLLLSKHIFQFNYPIMQQKIIYSLVLLIFCGIFYNFWRTEWKYLVPTPIPNAYIPVAIDTEIHLDSAIFKNTKPKFLHFFSPDCPCSKFTIAHFRYLVETYKKDVDFYAILFAEDTVNVGKEFAEAYKISIPLILVNHDKIATQCGVYSTPQVAIITKDKKLFFRGNYNKSRYCTNKNTNFAEIALQNLLNNKKAPNFGEQASQSYGCALPENYYDTLTLNSNYP